VCFKAKRAYQNKKPIGHGRNFMQVDDAVFQDLVRVAKMNVYSLSGESGKAHQEYLLIKQIDELPDWDDVDNDIRGMIYLEDWNDVDNDTRGAIYLEAWKQLEKDGYHEASEAN
jgi:hypothetical protein